MASLGPQTRESVRDFNDMIRRYGLHLAGVSVSQGCIVLEIATWADDGREVNRMAVAMPKEGVRRDDLPVLTCQRLPDDPDVTDADPPSVSPSTGHSPVDDRRHWH